MCSVASTVDLGVQSLAVNLGNVGGCGGPGEVMWSHFLPMQIGAKPHSAVVVNENILKTDFE